MFQGRPGFVRVAAAVATGACCLAAVACGSSPSTTAGASASASSSAGSTVDPLANLSAAKIKAEALADAEAASTLTIAGTVTQSGQTYTIDLAYKRGQGCAGTVGLGSKGSIKLILIGKTIYMNPDKQFWTAYGGSQGSTAYALINGRYLKTTTTDKNAAGLSDMCNVSQLLNSGSSASDVTFTKGPVTMLNGTRVLQLKGSDGSVAYVTDTSKPEIAQVTAPKGTRDAYGTLKVSVDTPVTLAAPPASQVIDGSELGF